MDLELIDEAGPNAMKLTGLERSPMLWSFCGARRFGLEVSSFHVASTRFWEAVLLPCAVVVVVAFSSCMELWVGQCVSLACWYAVNYYAMGYTLQVLHPQNASGLLWLSPFGGTLQLALWSVSLALLEVVLLHTTSRTLAQTVGTVLYATCGCLWLHLWIAPWRWLPEGWRPHSWVFRRREDREKRQGSSPTEETESPRRRPDSRRSEEGSLAGHAALAIAGYALLITFQQAFPSPTRRPSSGPPHDGPSSRLSRPPDPRRPTAPLSPFQVKKWSPSPNSTRSRWSRTKVFPRTYVGDRSRPSTQAPVAFGPGHASASRNSSLDQDAGTANSVARANATWTGTPETRRLNQAGGSGGGNGDRLTLPSVSTDGDSEAADKATSRFQALDALIPLGACVMLLLMMLDSGKSLEFSIPHLVCYNLLCLRIPDVLGHWVVTTVTRLQMAPSTTTTAISFAYMGAMQGYLMALKWVCRHMSAPDMFPRFQFVAQMYYYLFWYMMLMVLSPGGVEDRNFWMLVFFLNGVSLASNAGLLNVTRGVLWPGSVVPDPPLKVLFDSKLAVQDQLADVVSLLVVPAIASSFHLCTSLRVPSYPIRPLLSLWQRFLVLLLARLLSGLLTEEIFRRRVDVLNKAEALELQLLPIDGSQNRTRYLSDICIGPKLALEAMRNIERCELYFATVAVVCTFSVFQKGDWPTRYAFIAFGM